MAAPKIPQNKHDPKAWEPVDDRIRGKKPQATQAPATKQVRPGDVSASPQPEGGYKAKRQPTTLEGQLKETKPPPQRGSAVFGERPVVFPLEAPSAPPVDPKLATPEELMARRDPDGNLIPITFPITELATPAELAARKANEAAKVAQARTPNVKQKPRVQVKLHKPPPEPQHAAKKLIAADVKADSVGMSSKSPVLRPNIEYGHRFLIEGREITAGRITNFGRMDPATRKNHIPEGKVMINLGREHLLLNRDDYETIAFLQAHGGHVVAPD